MSCLRWILGAIFCNLLLTFSMASAAPSDPICQDKKAENSAARQKELEALTKGDALLTAGGCPSLPPPPPSKQPELEKGELRSISRSVKRTDGKEQKFDFKYGHYNRGKAKTMVVIKGGPNAGSWVDKTTTSEFKDYNLIVIELPGAGHNRFGEEIDFASEVGTDAAARLARDVIQKEGLTNYVIAGHSYGTTVATGTAALLSAQKQIAKPKGVLLMGTVGRATRQLPTGHEVTEGPKNVSTKAYNQLSASEKERFKALVKHANAQPNGASEVAGSFLSPLSGDFKTGMAYIREMLSLTPEQAMACMRRGRPAPEPGGTGGPSEAEQLYSKKFYMYAGCELVSGDNAMDTSHFFAGELISSRPNACFCSPSPRIGTYDSSKLKIKDIPLFYVSATDDFNTPPMQSKYHQQNQTLAASKTVFESETGGHALGFAAMMRGGCGSAIDGIFSRKPGQFKRELSSCQNYEPSPSISPPGAPLPPTDGGR